MDAAERATFARSVRHAVETTSGSALDSALDELEWRDALATDRADAVVILFEVLGTEGAACEALSSLVAGALGLELAPSAGVLLPALGQCVPPALLTADRVAVSGLGHGSLMDRDTVWLVATSSQGVSGAPVPLADLTRRPVAGMDPELGLVEVTGTMDRDALEWIDLADQWGIAVAVAQRALGHQLVGSARAMLELARQHALERVQFGHAISQFQAVRHRLAETLVAIESAEAVLAAAWEDDSPTTAAAAKALAGRGARLAARHCQQVLAGIGFTTEHPFHRYARRTVVLDQLFGASRSLTKAFGAELLAAGRLPDFAPL